MRRDVSESRSDVGHNNIDDASYSLDMIKVSCLMAGPILSRGSLTTCFWSPVSWYLLPVC